MSMLFDSKLLQKLDSLFINTKVRSSNMGSGNRKSISKGSSVEFSDYREYTSGDDFRRIDWNAYGKFEKMFIKLYMEEREVSVNIFLDCSKSMDFGEPNKGLIAKKLAGSIGYICMKNFDKISLNCISSKLISSKGNLKDKSAFKNLVEFIENIEFKDETNILESIKQVRTAYKKGISIVISDLYTNESLEDIVKFLTFNKQEVYILNILSPQELNPNLHDNVRLQDMESSNYIDLKVTSSILEKYKLNLKELIIDYKQKCRACNAHFVNVSSGEEIENIIYKLYF